MTLAPTGTDGTQAAPAVQPQAGTPQPQAGDVAAAAAVAADNEAITVDPAVLQRELAEARREAARYRTENNKLTAAQKAAAEAELSDLQKANTRIAELERERDDLLTVAQERILHVATVDIAARLGFRSPELAFKLIDRADVEFAEDGHAKNVEALLKAVLVKEPYLAKAAGGDFGGGATRGGTPETAPSMNDLLKRAARG